MYVSMDQEALKFNISLKNCIWFDYIEGQRKGEAAECYSLLWK
jgi:hypothetical protein